LLLRRLTHKISRLREVVAEKRRELQPLRQLVYAYAPLEITHYVRILRQARALPDFVLSPFAAASGQAGGPARLFVRHDLDTALCVEQLPMILDIDRQERVPAAVFVRLDGLDYPPAAAVAVLRGRSDRVEIGLHSSCYLEDDYLSAFRRETERFTAAFGFVPRSFTVHGLGEFRANVRDRFVATVAPRLGDFGYEFSDCDTSLRRYNYIFQDCHPEAGTGRRYISDDFVRISNIVRRGGDYLLLTHPCYWRQRAEQ
jgi:hypothetical protein